MIRIHFNPDYDHCRKILSALEKKNGHCPCRIGESPDTVCMCKDFLQQMQESDSGHCHCNLFYFEKE